jgi:site-specific recombinase XerC
MTHLDASHFQRHPDHRGVVRPGFGSGPQLVPIRGARTPSTARHSRHGLAVPTAIAGDTAARRFLEFFAATIRNKNTRMACYRAVTDFFAWLDAAGIGTLVDIEPVHVATYIEALQDKMAKPTVKQHLAAIRMLFDWLVTGGILASNPATSVRSPKHVIKRGKTPVLTTDQARVLIESIDTSTFVGLRDRALEGRFTLAPIFRSCRGG